MTGTLMMKSLRNNMYVLPVREFVASAVGLTLLYMGYPVFGGIFLSIVIFSLLFGTYRV